MASCMEGVKRFLLEEVSLVEWDDASTIPWWKVRCGEGISVSVDETRHGTCRRFYYLRCQSYMQIEDHGLGSYCSIRERVASNEVEQCILYFRAREIYEMLVAMID
ncbi:hypothetical protein TWF694_011676 [Orbilia ellipsospora]|uniref:Uncharacterized protein n=1 Tax=Orbilia ellipsospora TaxID=2528407 RepID=A0AAV9X763_9PEZI